MPKFLEERLKAMAGKKGLTGKRKDSYIFGTMNKMGMMKGNKVTAKGKMAEEIHKRSKA